MRRPLVAGNWKMNKTVGEARAYAHELAERELPAGVDVVIAPPFTAIAAVAEAVRGSAIAVCAQNMHDASFGPYTGEVSPIMLRDVGATWVLLGHSERRAACGETDAGVRVKVRSALAHGLTPIVAVGETAEEHRAGLAFDRVTEQTRAAFAGLADDAIARCVIAYEPIWAIGTGAHDEPASANATIAAIRGAERAFADLRILYGGSMKPENAAALMAQPHIDGGLIGGASLLVGTFVPCIEAAARQAMVP